MSAMWGELYSSGRGMSSRQILPWDYFTFARDTGVVFGVRVGTRHSSRLRQKLLRAFRDKLRLTIVRRNDGTHTVYP
jgi:hypothetical protein